MTLLNPWFGEYGGMFVPQILMPALNQLEAAFVEAQQDPAFQAEFTDLLKNYAGRPTALTLCQNLTKGTKTRLYLKREDLLHGGHAAVRRVLTGENKVCGLTRTEDAQTAHAAGAIFGGLIFAAGSPRQIDVSQAARVIAAAPLKYVGVFRNAPVEEVAQVARELGLAAVQLHGDEDRDFVAALRDMLPASTQIWKAFSVKETLPARDWPHVDRYVLDNGAGGSGQRFDWNLLQGEKLDNVLLAGGLAADNAVSAAQLGCAGLDFNSGVESAPGIKDHSKLAAVFQTLRAY